MSDTSGNFAKFVPGFDFLQNLAKAATQSVPQLPNMTQWVAPTLSVEDLDKRLTELRAVQFWLDQNARALAATIQALEVQKMTLATLKGMNFNLSELAQSFKLKVGDAAGGGLHQAAAAAASTAQSVAKTAQVVHDVAHTAEAAAASAQHATTPQPSTADGAADKGKNLIDPIQVWGALTQQFQQIAAGAMQEVGKAAAQGLTRRATKASTAKPVEPATPEPKKPSASKAKAPATRARTSARGTKAQASPPRDKR